MKTIKRAKKIVAASDPRVRTLELTIQEDVIDLVKEGNDSRDDIYNRLMDQYDGSMDEIYDGNDKDGNSEADIRLGDLVEAVTTRMLEKHYREQATWPQTTDCDRLEAAFSCLADNGIVTLHNVLDGEADYFLAICSAIKAAPKGTTYVGFAFYTQNAARFARRYRILGCTFGVTMGESWQYRLPIVNNVIRDTLSTHGMHPESIGNEFACRLPDKDGSLIFPYFQSMYLIDFDWKKRRNLQKDQNSSIFMTPLNVDGNKA